MATQASLDQIQNLYIAFYGRPADAAGQTYWANELEAADGDLSAIINAFATSDEYQRNYGDLEAADLVNALYQQILGRDAEQAGLDFYVGELAEGNITEGEIALAILNGAQGDDTAVLANRKAVADAFTAAVEAAGKEYGEAQEAAAKAIIAAVGADTDPATVNVAGTINGFPDAQEGTGPSVEGETFVLTEGRDNFTGTDNDDTFIGMVGQNQNGAVSNAFATGDIIDGGAGRDKIEASMIADNEVDGADANLNPRPVTRNVEEVFIEALDNVTLDATRMEGVEEFWSDFSRGDMTFTGVNLRGSNLNITKDVTFGIKDTMHGTDFNGLFDSLSLTREAASQSNSQLLVRIADVSTETPEAPLTNVNLNLSFDLGEDTITLENVQSTDGSYAGLVTAIKNALALEGYANLTVELSTPYSQVTFADNTVNLPFIAQEILVTDPAGNEFDNVSFTQSAIQPVAGGFLVAGNAQPLPPGASSNLIESNLVLDNAGNGSLAGDVVIGAMSNSDKGVERINVMVDRTSHIESLNTTNEKLQEIHISSLEAEGDLWIGGTQDDLREIDANAFAGANLSLGQGDIDFDSITGDDPIVNLEFLDAAGTSANVTFVADYDGVGRASSEQAFVVNTGSGNDNITADLTGTSTSGSTQASLSISSTGGNNTVELTSTGAEVNTATVTLGAGNDTVTGGMTHLTANTGAGDDVVYAENTGTKTEGILAAGSTIASAVAFAAVGASGQDVNEVELLNGRTVTVTFNITNLAAADTAAFTKGYEATAVIEASNGVLTTERDFYEAAAKAINEDSVISKLASAVVDSNGDLIVTSLVDGVSVLGDDLVTLGLSGVAADLSPADRAAILEAVQDKIDDSTETAVNVNSAYDAVALAATDVVDVTTIGTDSTVAGGSNTVNAGAGNDVIVLNSNTTDTLSDTIVFDAGQIGNNAIVHFEAVTGLSAEDDVLDFTAWLNNTTDASTNANSLSETRVLTTLAASEAAFDENAVVITDFNTLNGATTTVLDFANMTDAQVLAALNEDATFANVLADSTLVGNVQKSIMFVENNDATQANAGEYKVYQVTSTTAAGDDNFTAVTLIGTLDFGASVAFELDNFA